jgi:hypothetical protein
MRSSTPLRVSGAGIGGIPIDFSSEDRRTEAMIAFMHFLIVAAAEVRAFLGDAGAHRR